MEQGYYDPTSSEEYKEFLVVKKNKDSCLKFLMTFVQKIEKEWGEDGEGERRIQRLKTLALCLGELKDHKNADLQELSRLSDKMKGNYHLSQKHFLGLFLPIERKYTRGLADHQFLSVDTLDADRSAQTETKEETMTNSPTIEKIPLTIVLDNLRSAFNVGAIFRTAECIGVEKVYLCGYTSTPDDKNTQQTTMGTHKYVPWEWQQHTAEVIDMLKAGEDGKGGRKIIALETVKDQPNIYEYKFPALSEGGCVLLLGNERYGIEVDLLNKCDAIVRIPCCGVKNSLNVGVAFGVCGYEIVRQWKFNT